MQILPVNNYPNYKNTNFKSVKITNAGNEILNGLKPYEHEEFNNIKNELENLVHWDMIIDKSKDLLEIIHIKFVNRFNKNLVHELGITPINRNGNKVRIQSPNNTKKPSYKTEELLFPNEGRAKALMDMYKEQLNMREENDIRHTSHISVLLKIQEAAKEITFLDEAYEYMAKINPNLYSKAAEKEIPDKTKKIPWWLKFLEKLSTYDD